MTQPRWQVWAALFALAILLAPAAGAAAAESEDSSPGAQVDALFEELRRSDAPGGVAAVIQDGRIVHEVAYGMADLERGVAVTPRSVFEIGSVSKQFTAMCVLLLEHEGKLSLDDDVRTYLPELPVYERPVTLRHLLHHTSGIRDIETLLPLAGWPYPNYYAPDRLVGLITRQRALNFPPGSQFLYSNSGYLLLAQVVERVSGKTLRELAAERIFEPLGMRHTVFFDNPHQVIADRAIPYSQGDDGGYRMELWYLPFTGPSGLYTSVEDLARWDANFYDNKLGGGAELIAEMQTPGRLDNGESTGYADGLVVDDGADGRVIHHGGAWMGYRASMQRFPDQHLTVIQLSNASTIPVSSGAIADLYREAAEAAGEEGEADEAAEAEPPPTVELAPEVLARYEGTYWNEADQLLRTIEVRDGVLHYVRSETSSTELGALEAGRFVMLGVGAEVEVAFASPEGGGAPRMTVTVEGEEPLEFRPVEPQSTASLASSAGRYWSDELGRELRLTLDGADLYLSWADEDERAPLVQLAPDDLLARRFVPVPWYHQDVRLKVERDPSGRVTGLTLSCDMVRGIELSRQTEERAEEAPRG